MVLVKATASVDEWAQVAAAAIREGAAIDVSVAYEGILHIVIAHDSINAHALGAKITVETRAGDGDEDWREYAVFQTGGGTAVKVDVDVECAAAATQLKVASTGGSSEFETKNDLYFVKNAAIANSEIVRNNGFSDNDYITILDGLENTQEVTADVFNIVEQFRLELPLGCSTARVLVWNNDADCTICTKTDLEQVTSLS